MAPLRGADRAIAAIPGLGPGATIVASLRDGEESLTTITSITSITFITFITFITSITFITFITSITFIIPKPAILSLMPQGFSLALFDAVLFDIDGTLVDSLEMIIPGLADTFEKYSGIRPSDSEVQATIGLPLCVQFRQTQDPPPSEDRVQEMIEYAISRYEIYSAREKPFGPAIETLRLCKQMGLGTALVTSRNAKEMALFMNRFPGADSVDVTICVSDVNNPKPAPDSALLALSRLGTTANRAVLIGDSIYDMRCARAAGVAQVAVGYGSATQLALCAEHPDHFIETPDALLDWAQQSFLNRNAPQESNNRRIIDPDSEDRSEGAA